MGLSNAYATQIGKRIFQAAAGTWPTTLTVKLWTVANGPDGTGGTEATGASYAGQSLTPTSAHWPETSGQPGQFTNATAIDFGTIDVGGWGTLVEATIEDQAAVIIATATISVDTSAGGTLVFDIGDLVFDLNPA